MHYRTGYVLYSRIGKYRSGSNIGIKVRKDKNGQNIQEKRWKLKQNILANIITKWYIKMITKKDKSRKITKNYI